MNRNSRQHRDTYIYIDVSNIRLACLKTLGIRLDFVKLLDYLKKRYPNARDIRYYEGISIDDAKKRGMFNFLAQKGYTICDLERKSYHSVEVTEQEVKCPKCGNRWIKKFSCERKVLKSNVDVYLASDMVAQASSVNHPINLVLVSCDGDYAEAVKTILRLNPDASIEVLATPLVKDPTRNTLSTRLRKLASITSATRFAILNIDDVRDKIASS